MKNRRDGPESRGFVEKQGIMNSERLKCLHLMLLHFKLHVEKP
jgi:hypothetical protein